MTKSKQVFHVRLLSFELFIPGAQSLKQKRSCIHGLKDQIKARFNASVAELNFQDKWQRSAIGIAVELIKNGGVVRHAGPLSARGVRLR